MTIKIQKFLRPQGEDIKGIVLVGTEISDDWDRSNVGESKTQLSRQRQALTFLSSCARRGGARFG